MSMVAQRLRLGIAGLVGLAFPYVELAWKCRAPMMESEACVWARAYLPLSRWVEPLIVAPIVWLLLAAAGRLLIRGKPAA